MSKLESIKTFISAHTDNFTPEIAIILGSGLGALADLIDRRYTISYKDIPHFPTSTVSGHNGQLIFGYIGGWGRRGQARVAMQGRFHYYEGYDGGCHLPVRISNCWELTN